MNKPPVNESTKRLFKQRYVNALIGDAKKFLTGLFDGLASKVTSHVFVVSVKNQDTNLTKEVAANTRGLKGKLQELIVKPAPEMIKVSNLDEIKIPEIPEFPAFPKIPSFPEIPPFPSKIDAKVTNLGDIKFPEPTKPEKVDLTRLETSLDALRTALDGVLGYLPQLKPQKITFPKQTPIKIPDKVSVREAKEIVDALQGVRDDLGEVHKAITEIETSTTTSPVAVAAKSGGATVTSVNVNALRGIPQSTSVTVSTVASPLPTTSLPNRKTLIAYNNSSTTLYLGGTDVSSSNGFPVGPQSYSPPIDAGATMKVYGVVQIGNANVRVLEVSSEREGA